MDHTNTEASIGLPNLRKLAPFGRVLKIPWIRKSIINLFHVLYYGSDLFPGGWMDVNWLGRPVLKCPFDLWIYQEIIFNHKPDIIIESGSYQGGSALFLASVCDLVARGRIISIDQHEIQDKLNHPRIRFLTGQSIHPSVLSEVQELIDPFEKVMVILDSDHRMANVLEELHCYARFVTPGSYLVVEDTNINGHPVYPNFGPGPREAVQNFLQHTDNFIVVNEWEKFFLTFNPGGYLKRIV